MSTVTEVLKNLKAEIERGKTEKTRAETTLEGLIKQQKEIESELVALGVKPEDLDTEISRLDQEILAGLNEAEQLLRGPVEGGSY